MEEAETEDEMRWGKETVDNIHVLSGKYVPRVWMMRWADTFVNALKWIRSFINVAYMAKALRQRSSKTRSK
ncbi:hypothetical protein U1Q18_051909, partial [Sarracenia purpurea var. burkii]